MSIIHHRLASGTRKKITDDEYSSFFDDLEASYPAKTIDIQYGFTRSKKGGGQPIVIVTQVSSSGARRVTDLFVIKPNKAVK